MLQRLRIEAVWPEMRCEIARGLLTCRGTVRPSPLSGDYEVRLNYKIGKPPLAWVDSPPLVSRSPDERIPHTYTIGGLRPCLYHGREWTVEKWLALTILPWLLVWLFFYEVWFATGVWKGEGVDHLGIKQLQAS